MKKTGTRRSRASVAALVAAAAALWLAGAPGTAFGQGSTWAGAGLAQMVETAGWRLGMLRINAALQLMSAGYDSDVYYGYRREASPDMTATASVPVQAFLPLSKKVVVEVNDTPSYAFYLKTDRERAWNNSFSGRFHFIMDKVYFQAGGGLSNVRRRMSSELDLNIREKKDHVGGLVLWQAGKGIAMSVVYEGAKYDFGDSDLVETSLPERLNRTEHHFDLIAYAQPAPRVRFFVDARYGTYTFAEPESSFRDARSYGIFGGLEFLPRVGEVIRGLGLQGSVSLGYVRFDLLDPEWMDGSGFGGQASLSGRIMKKTTARVSFSRGYNFSVLSGASFYLQTTLGAGVSRSLSKKATLSYDISFGRSAYPGDFYEDEEPFLVLTNRYTAHTLSLRLRASRRLDVTFLGRLSSRVRLRSDEPFNRSFLGFNLIYSLGRGAG
jgi:hypothetical protein